MTIIINVKLLTHFIYLAHHFLWKKTDFKPNDNGPNNNDDDLNLKKLTNRA